MGMRGNRIEFISDYCDRWCERCAFTSRCSSYAVHAAMAMCGNFEEAIELAVGTPRAVGATRDADDSIERPWLDIPEPTPQELRAIDKEEKARKRRIADLPVTKIADRAARMAHEWFRARSDAVRGSGDAVVVETLEIVEWDSHLIGAKLHRALSGRDRHQADEGFDDDPVQNDWNGSAKVALISLDRSEAAWLVIAQATGDVHAADLATAMADLRGEVERAFPFARLFKRPGFDEPDR
jgi:hypothetical protein